MSRVAGSRFACAGCGRTYRWKPELAGKELRCGCGHVLLAPLSIEDASQPAPHESDSLYDLAPESEDAKKRVAPVMRSIPHAPPTAPTIGYAQPATPSPSAPPDFFPDRVRDFQMPVALIAGRHGDSPGVRVVFRCTRSVGVTGRTGRDGPGHDCERCDHAGGDFSSPTSCAKSILVPGEWRR